MNFMDRLLAIKWLFFLRDVRAAWGNGEVSVLSSANWRKVRRN